MRHIHVSKMTAKLVLATSLSFAAMGQANASWLAHSKDFTDWKPSGNSECTEWFPSADVVDWGKPLVQSRKCKIEEVRDQITYERSKYTGEIRERSRESKSRFSIRKERRDAKGTLDSLIEVVTAKDWTEWSPIEGRLRQCDDPVDVSVSHDLHSGVIDFQSCEQQVERRLPIVEHWLSGKEVRRFKDEDVESKWVPRLLTWSNVGKQDKWLEPKNEYARWVSVGTTRDCSSPDWEAMSKQFPWGLSLDAWVECKQPQQRMVKKVRYRLSGLKEVIEEKEQTRTIPVLYADTYVGQKDYVVSVEKDAVIADWHPLKLNPEDCSDEILVSANLEWGVPVTTHRTCVLKEQFTTGTKEIMASGKVNVRDEAHEERESERLFVANDIGYYDHLIERTDQFRYGEWKVESSWDCRTWSPFPHDVELSEIYMQSRDCRMSRSRSAEQLVKWDSGDKWESVARDFDAIERKEVRFESGLKLAKYALPEQSIVTSIGNEVSGDVVTVDSVKGFQRINVTLEFDGNETDWKDVSVVLIGPKGNGLDIPLIRSGVTLFFDLADYNELSSGDWVMKVKDNRKSGEPITLKAKLELQQVAPKIGEPAEI